MKLSPKGYKRLVRVAACVELFNTWCTDRGQQNKWKAVFKSKWPAVFKLAEQSDYREIFWKAMAEIAKGELDGKFAKAFA
jgi:hypothetical protein